MSAIEKGASIEHAASSMARRSGASGEFGVYLDSKGDKSPYRMKMRPMGLTLTGALDPMLRGQKIADLITTGAAIDFVIPDIDR